MLLRNLLRLFVLLLFLAVCTASALAQDSAQDDTRWWLAQFGQTGRPEVRKLLHARPRYSEVKQYRQMPDMPMREHVAVEPAIQGGGMLTLVTYEGLFLCGSRGCTLEVLRGNGRGKWKVLLSVTTEPGYVGFGPDSSHGLKDIVFLGRHSVQDLCPVWRFDGKRYDFDGLMDSDREPCRALNEKNARESAEGRN